MAKKDMTSLEVEVREKVGKGASRAIRRSGMVPGVIYGEKKSPIMFSIDPRVLYNERKKKGFWNRMFEIKVDGKKNVVMCQDVQVDPVTDFAIHVDFMRINKDKEIHFNIPVKIINEEKSKGLKKGGVLNIVRREIEVICKPDDIPEEFVIDLSALDIGDSIHVDDLEIPEHVVAADADKVLTVLTITSPSRAEPEEGEEEETEAAVEGEETETKEEETEE